MIVRDPEICAGHPTIRGTRSGVHNVVSNYQLYDRDLNKVREEVFPHLSLAQLQAAIDWYDRNQQEIDDILRQRREDYERGLCEQQRRQNAR